MKRAVSRQAIGVALFPFLAVLICTMGSLIVLLVLFVGKGRVDAQTIVAAQQAVAVDPEAARKAQEAFEDAQWRRELLEQQRTEKSAELADARARLAHLEEHIGRLAARAKELLARAHEIDAGQEPQDNELTAAQTELKALQAEIARKRSELERARADVKGREQWYALIPYDGPNGTRRRPIYLECTERGIVLQPEGIVFRPADFNGPMGPGNPLDAALRTVREHLLAAGAQAGEPYPLLVVRPSGVVAYGAARSALKSWDDEFGYELISDDKRLAFGDADPALAAKLQQSVGIARQRQAALVAAMPRRFQDEQPLTSFDASEMPGYAPGAFASDGRGVGTGRGGAGTNQQTVGGTTNARSGSGLPSNVPPGGAAGEPGDLPPGGDALAQGGSSTGGQAGPYGAAPQAGGASASAGGGTPGGPSLPGATGTVQGGAAGGSSLSTAAPAQAVPGQTLSDPTGQQAGGQQGMASISIGGTRPQGSAVASGKSKGSNWGIPGATTRTTGVTRPMHVVVLADRVILVPEAGSDRPQQTVPLSPQLQPAEVDAFVELVKKEMKSWGVALAGGYWKPVLQMEVAPDAQSHFADLSRGLEGSGYEIQRKQ